MYASENQLFISPFPLIVSVPSTRCHVTVALQSPETSIVLFSSVIFGILKLSAYTSVFAKGIATIIKATTALIIFNFFMFFSLSILFRCKKHYQRIYFKSSQKHIKAQDYF